MLKMLSRIIICLHIMIAVLILLSIVWGRQLNRLPDLWLQISYPPDAPVYTIVDFENRVAYQYATANTQENYSLAPNGEIGYQRVWEDALLHIYLQSSDQIRPSLLGAYATADPLVPIVWASDSQALYIANKSSAEILELLHIDLSNGLAQVVGQYPFENYPISGTMYDEQHLIFWGSSAFIWIDSSNGNYYSDSSSRFPRLSFDHRYLVYGMIANLFNPTVGIYILDTETLAVQRLGTDFISTIEDYDRWSPGAAILPVFGGGRTLLYHADTGIYQALPQGYHINTNSYPWSADGQRLFVSHELADGRIEYGYMAIETEAFTSVFIADTRIGASTFNYSYGYVMQWSPDESMLLAFPGQLSTHLIYTIYDVETGNLLYSANEPLERRASFVYIRWWIQ